jgi:hypothetical protein
VAVAGDLPGPPSEPPGTEDRAGNPWERRSTLGIANAFIEAVKQFALSPGEAFSQTVKRGDFGSPLLFAIIVGWIGIAVGQIWELLMGASILSMMPPEMRGYLPFAAGSATGFLISVVFAPVWIIVGLFLWGAILHLCLVIVGGLGGSQAGFEGSFRVVAYSTVAQLANLVPIVGAWICVVWSIILTVIGVQKVHATSQGKAVVVVLIPIALCCACVAMAMAILGAGLMAMFANQ